MRMLEEKVNSKLSLYRKIILDNDGVIICPTDTVYGFFASSVSDIATQKIFNIKKRSLEKKLIVNVSSVEILKRYVYISDIADVLIKKFWPGKLSIIFNLTDFGLKHISYFITGNSGSICVRIPNHQQALELLDSVKIPLISTSVNLSGETPLNIYSDIVNSFKNKVDLILQNDLYSSATSMPSTIIDARRESSISIIRLGAISKEEIEDSINCCVKIV